MPLQDPKPPSRGLSPTQRRWLLWMPLISFELVMILIGKPAEGSRDWASLFVFGVLLAAVYVGIWYALVRITAPKTEATTEERLSSAGSRAALIYGGKESKPCEEDSSPEAP